jgi:hypothetical protein
MARAPAGPPWTSLRSKWTHPIAVALTLALLLWAAVMFAVIGQGVIRRGELGYDASFFALLGRNFLDTGQPYFPAQFAGPYPAEGAVNLYPPLILYLFVPFAVLPRALWWVIPLTAFGWHLWDCRPAAWTWPLMAFILGLVPTVAALLYGGTVMWSVAFIVVGLRFPAAGALLFAKPTDAVVAILFARRRSFWFGLGLVAVAALPFGTLWLDYLTAMGNVTGTSPLRNITGLPILALPVLAWVGRPDRRNHSNGLRRD